MRLVSYDRSGTRRLAAWVDDVVVDLPDAVGHPAFPGTLESLLAGNGGTTLDAARAALEYPGAIAEFAVPRAKMLSPLALSGAPPATVLEPGHSLTAPPAGTELVFRPQLAGIIGRAGSDLDETEAARALFGYTLVNAWSLRRLGERVLQPVGTSIGPSVATGDEFDPSGRSLMVTIDGTPVRQTRIGKGVRDRFVRTVVRASRKDGVKPGEIYGLSPFTSPIPVPTRRRRKGAPPMSVVVELAGIGRLQNDVRPR
ncbi:MAG: fumarylacetoacetate hydrolase family protein [Actinomycetota bacterium]